MDKKQWALKIAVILAGSVLSAYGITLAMYAGFGSATLAVLWQGISKVTGMSIGMASFAVAVVMIVFVWFYDRSQIHIGTILYQVVYSGFVEIFSGVQRYPGIAWLNFLLMCAGVVPQQPPTMFTKPASANSSRMPAVSSGASSYSPKALGRPALG